jgi:hypothetical protein
MLNSSSKGWLLFLHACGNSAASDWSSSGALNNPGILYLHQARWSDADACFAQSLATAEEVGDQDGVATALSKQRSRPGGSMRRKIVTGRR